MSDGVQRIQFSIGKKVEDMDFDELQASYEEVKEKYDSSIFDANGDGKVSGGEIYAGLLSIQSGKVQPKEKTAPAAEETETEAAKDTAEEAKADEAKADEAKPAEDEAKADEVKPEAEEEAAETVDEAEETRSYEQIMADEAQRLQDEANQLSADIELAESTLDSDKSSLERATDEVSKLEVRVAELKKEYEEYYLHEIPSNIPNYETEKSKLIQAISKNDTETIKSLDANLIAIAVSYDFKAVNDAINAPYFSDNHAAAGAIYRMLIEASKNTNNPRTSDLIKLDDKTLGKKLAAEDSDNYKVLRTLADKITNDADKTHTQLKENWDTAAGNLKNEQERVPSLQDDVKKSEAKIEGLKAQHEAAQAAAQKAQEDAEQAAKIPAIPGKDAEPDVTSAYKLLADPETTPIANGVKHLSIEELETKIKEQEEILSNLGEDDKEPVDDQNSTADNLKIGIRALKLYTAYRKGDTAAIDAIKKEMDAEFAAGIDKAQKEREAKLAVITAKNAPKEVQDAYKSLMDKENGYLSANIDHPEHMTIEYLESVNRDIDAKTDEEKSALPEGTKINLDLYIAYRKGDTDEVNKIIAEIKDAQNQVPTAAADDNAPEEPIENATLTKAAIVYQYAPIDNIMSAVGKDETKSKEFAKALSAVAQFYPSGDGINPIDTVRKLTLEEIDYAINAAEKTGHQEGKTAFEKLKAIVMENKDALNNGVLRHEAKEQVEPGMLAKAWGGTVATFKFLDENVLGISEANRGAKNAGKATGAQFKVNGEKDGGVSAILSGAGRIGAFVPSFASGAMGKVTNAGEKLTDAVDNMEDGALKDAARTGSGAVKMVDGVVNIFAGGVADQLSAFGKEGLFINQIWGASDNDEAIEELTNVAVDRILETLTSRPEREPLEPLKKDATDEEKEAYAKKKEEYEQKCEQDKIEAAYLVKVKDRLGLDDEALSKMSVSEKRNAIVRSVKDDRIPSEFIKVFAAKGIIEKGLIDQSKLLNNDSAEGIAKVKKGAGQVVDGAKDVVTGAANTVDNVAGLLLGGKGLFWGKPGLVKSVIPDEKPEQNDKAAAVTGAAAPVHTASTKEIIAEIREKRIAAWKAKEEEKWVNTILPKIEAKKNEIIDKMVPSDYIQGAIDAIVKESEGRVTADEAKRTIYKELGDKLEKNFSEFEKQRLFKRAMNEGEFGEDTFWADFFNWVDDATEQENSAGGRGFLKNFYTTALSFAGAPVKAVFGDMPYTVAQLAGGVPFISHQCFFMMFFGGSEHLEGLGNIIEGYSDYNSAQVATGYAQSGYALAKDWFISWGKHAVRKVVGDDTYCGCKPKPKPEPEPEPTPTEHEQFFIDPTVGELELPD